LAMSDSEDAKNQIEYKPPKKKRRKTSSVWNYFSEPEEVPNRGTIVRCSLCSWEMKYSSSTSGLRNHLTGKHQTILEPRDVSHSPEDINKVHGSLQQNLALWLCTNLLAPEQLDNKYFNQSYQPLRFSVPTSQVMRTAVLPTMLADLKRKTQSILQNVSSMAISCESWVGYFGENFVGLHGHFLDQQNAVRRIFLDVKQFPYATVPQVGSFVVDAIQEFASNNANMQILSVTSEDGPDSLLLNQLQTPVVHCVAQILQVALSSFLQAPQIRDYMQGIRSLLSVVINTPRIFASLLRQSQTSTELNLSLDDPTKWITTVAMIENFLNYNKQIQTSLQQSECYQSWAPLFEDGHMPIVRQVFAILQVFTNLARNFSVESYPRLSVVFPLLQMALNNLEESNLRSLPIFRVFERTAKPIIAGYIQNLIQTDMVLVATYLDLRFKEFQWLDFDVQLKSSCILRAKSWLSNKLLVNSDPEVYLDMFFAQSNPNSSTQETHNELESYHNETSIVATQWSKFKVVDWWTEKKSTFPHLFTICSQLLIIPVVSSAPEMHFSLDTKVSQFSKQRTLLRPADVMQMYPICQNVSILDT